MVIMGQLISLTSNPDGQTTYMHKGQKVKTKTNNMILVILQFHTQTSKQICRTTFYFLHNISRKRLTAIKIYLSKNGLKTKVRKTNILTSQTIFFFRVHGNKHRQQAHALTRADVTRAVQFIGNYAKDHGILLPGRIPGYRRCDLQLLPSNTTKKSVWELYVAATESVQIRVSSYRAFLFIWKKYLPHIVIIKEHQQN